MKRVAVMTSGGDAPGMNAATRAVVRTGVMRGFDMLGVRRGYTGLIGGEFVRLGPRDVGGIVHLGGTMLGTSRCDEFRTESGQLDAVRQLHTHEVTALVVIGGNGSQAGARDLARRGVSVIGVASTIDNDLAGTDISIGATTAIDTALEAIDRLRVTASAHQRTFLVEVMGRHSGYLAALAGIAGGAEAIVIPEREIEPEALAEHLQASRQRGKSHAIVVVAEGARHNVEVLCAYFQEHRARLGLDLRVTRLGHVQRGGAPGAYDRILASRLGAAAIDRLAAGEHGVLVGTKGGAIVTTPLGEVAGRTNSFDERVLDLADVLAT